MRIEELTKRIKTIRGVLFDVDGTLMNVEERFYYHYNENLSAFGIHPVTRGYYEFMRERGILSSLIPDRNGKRQKFWMRFIEKFSNSDHPELGEPFPGTLETLEWLKARNYKMGIVTGRTSTPERVMEELEIHGLANFFEFVLTNNDGIDGMNKANNLITAAHKLNLKVHQCAYVGDWQGDVQSASEAGIGLIIAVLSGGESKQSIERFNPHVILESVADIPAFLGNPSSFLSRCSATFPAPPENSSEL
jgi:phosphoglycolate phosphatase